jgi:hypothetical protein
VVILLFNPSFTVILFVLTYLIDALMFATCFEASYNGETPWEEVSDRARGEEEERAG